jgi:hypothetical protein
MVASWAPMPSSSSTCPSSPALTSRRCCILAIAGLLEPPRHHTQPHSSLLLLPPAPWIEATTCLRRWSGHAIGPCAGRLREPPHHHTSSCRPQRLGSKGRGIANRRLPPNTDPLGTPHSFSSSTSKAPIFWPTNSDIMEG